jgi:hypothetical protein
MNHAKMALEYWTGCRNTNDKEGMKFFADIILKEWNVDVNNKEAFDKFISETLLNNR